MTEDDVVASLAVTLDGYVARPDGSVDYLERHPVEDYDFERFAAGIGALIMGSITYEQAVGWGWMWGDRPTVVLTTRDNLPVPAGANIRFVAKPTAAAIRELSVQTPKRLWVFGGGRVITEGLLGGAIDTLDLMVVPEAIGAGLPLFTQPYAGPMRLVEAVAYAGGAVRLLYDTRPA